MVKQKLSIVIVAFLLALALVAPMVLAAGPATQIAVNNGQGQSATVGTAVPVPISVVVKDAANDVVAGASVTFAVASGGGSATGTTAITDASGVATLGSWTLGTTAGVNTLTATTGSLTPVTFSASGTAGAATQLLKNAGDSQTATVGTAVAIPPSVIVKDTNGNPVSGISVTFAPVSGTVGSTTVTTGVDGIASSGGWTLGSTAGTQNLVATVSGLSAVTFSATGTSSTAAPTLSSITPSSGYNTSTLGTTTLAGTGFSTSTVPTVVLRRSGSTNITATGVSATATSITCTLDIINKEAGNWDVIVTNPDGQYVILTNGFQIVSSSGQVTLSSITPATSITNKTVSITSLAGTNFAGTPQVYLKKSTYNSIYGTFTTSSSILLTGTFNLTNVVPTTYEVCVKNSGADAVCGLSFIVSPMQQTNGSIYFTSSPSGSSVFVDSVSKGTTPFTLYNLTPGTYSIRMQKSEYLDWADRVTVTSGNETKVNGVLSYQNSATTATTEPTVVITTATMPPTTVKSTKTVPTPWADTATPASPVDVLVVAGAVGLGIVLLRRQ